MPPPSDHSLRVEFLNKLYNQPGIGHGKSYNIRIIVALPTSSGKTLAALRAIDNILAISKDNDKKIVVICPSFPFHLALQTASNIKSKKKRRI